MFNGKLIEFTKQDALAMKMSALFMAYAERIGCTVVHDEIQIRTKAQRTLLSQRWEELCKEHGCVPPGGFKK